MLEFQRKDERRANSHRREGDSEGKVDRSLMLYELFPYNGATIDGCRRHRENHDACAGNAKT